MALPPGTGQAAGSGAIGSVTSDPSSSLAEKISAVLPLKTRGRHYADNVGRCDILFASLRAFTRPEIFERFVIVVPHNEIDEVRQYTAAWSDFPIQLVDEEEHFGIFQQFSARHQVRPWHRQQIIKLYAPALVNTEYFMVFDPDVFATRPFNLNVLLPGGRALTHFQPRQREPRFWEASARILKQDPHLERDGLWWTPALLSSTLCRRLHARLEDLYGEHWMRVLLARYTVDWTEYTLYWLNAEREGLLDRYHARPVPGMPELHVDESIWYAGPRGSNLARWDAARHFAPDAKGIFAVVQSNTGLSIPTVLAKLQPFLQVQVQPYRRYTSWSLQVAEFYSAAVRRLMGKVRGLLRRP